MTKSQDFIIEKLNTLYTSIEGVKIRYEYREFMAAHFVEILPINTFENNQEYILLEMEIQDQFEMLFGSNEEILFISSDSLNKIKDVQFSLGYNDYSSIQLEVLKTQTFSFTGLENMNTVDNTSYALAA
jgi:hypothetical protein